jgi:ketosteroid isomerase-like protein
MALSLDEIVDRLAIEDCISHYTSAIDARDWEGLRARMTPDVHIDYSSNGSGAYDLTSEAWAERLKVLYGFNATLHMVTNFRVKVDGDKAVCRTYVLAFHFLREEGQEQNAFAGGEYVYDMVRRNGEWLISRATFLLAGRLNPNEEYLEAFARARELAPQKTPRTS